MNRRLSATWLLLPALAMLVLGFALPLVSFFVRVFLVDHTVAATATLFAQVLTSRVMVFAIGTTVWIALLVTLAVLIAATRWPTSWRAIVAGE